MRIALDLTPLVGRFPTSIERVARGARDALLASREVEIVELAPSDPKDLTRSGLRRWRQRTLPWLAEEAGADLLHTFCSAFPLRSRVPVVQTVHELPWKHGVDENAGIVHRAWAWLGKRRARAQCVPSEGVARDLAGPNVHVVPWGVSREFLGEVSVEQLRERIPELPEPPFVLAPGGGRAKKRIDLASDAARDAGTPMVITGSTERDDPDDVHLGHVDEDLMPALYEAAAATFVLADSEGFGLPVLESLARGTGVIVPKGTVQAATAGGLAYEVDPADELADAVRAVLFARGDDEDEEIDAERRRFAAQHTWERTAARLVEVWRSVL
ncbi:MAG: glycosyltransferase [Planctomycetota bacterium]